MNVNQSQGQAPQVQPASQQQQAARQLPLFRPEQMRALPEQFSAEEKQKWENGLIMLYKAIENNPPDSSAHQESKKKLHDFSVTLHKKILNFKRPQQNQGQARAPNQGQASQVPGDGTQSAQNQGQQARPQSQPHKPSEAMLKYINEYSYTLPPQVAAGTPDALKWLADAKNRFGKALLAAETSGTQLKNLDSFQKERGEQGNPLSQEEQAEFNKKKESYQKNYADAKRYIDEFRKAQEKLKAERAGGAPQQPGGNITAPGLPRPTLNIQQQAPNTAQKNTQTVNAAIEAARNQGMNAARPNQGLPEQMPPFSIVQSNSPQGPGNQGANMKVDGANQPQINTAMATAPHVQQQRPAHNSPHSAVPQSATSVGPPRPLTHQAAVAQANRTYSSGQPSGTPSVMASHSHPSLPRESGNPVSGNKMPIPKQLPPGAIGTPQPVSMQPSRPTMSGGPNNAGIGSLGQPVLQRTPAFNLEGEGERVLNKKKLDELVRQVTGGGEGLDSGEGLTPEVEDCVLSVADEFVDQVISAACKCAKARGSKTLEIRDIQLILERNHNIRIPGYASDEIRTVRKFQPAQGWIAKMSAIQAAKVTGGKGDL
ncbi:MAG: hypothetical protein M1818_007927 [Claussenomyces sp. TS43310]|nr:MAG: hypothetical protein M1818_007927 [Claussenomyces sp. TS43310]